MQTPSKTNSVELQNFSGYKLFYKITGWWFQTYDLFLFGDMIHLDLRIYFLTWLKFNHQPD